jgi:hypothetical protein
VFSAIELNVFFIFKLIKEITVVILAHSLVNIVEPCKCSKTSKIDTFVKVCDVGMKHRLVLSP